MRDGQSWWVDAYPPPHLHWHTVDGSDEWELVCFFLCTTRAFSFNGLNIRCEHASQNSLSPSLYLLRCTVKKTVRWPDGRVDCELNNQKYNSVSLLAGRSKQQVQIGRWPLCLYSVVVPCCGLSTVFTMSLVRFPPWSTSSLQKSRSGSWNVWDDTKRLPGSVVDDSVTILPAFNDASCFFLSVCLTGMQLSLSWKRGWSRVLLFLMSLAVANLTPPLTFRRTISVLVLVTLQLHHPCQPHTVCAVCTGWKPVWGHNSQGYMAFKPFELCCQVQVSAHFKAFLVSVSSITLSIRQHVFFKQKSFINFLSLAAVMRCTVCFGLAVSGHLIVSVTGTEEEDNGAFWMKRSLLCLIALQDDCMRLTPPLDSLPSN